MHRFFIWLENLASGFSLKVVEPMSVESLKLDIYPEEKVPGSKHSSHHRVDPSLQVNRANSGQISWDC